MEAVTKGLSGEILKVRGSRRREQEGPGENTRNHWVWQAEVTRALPPIKRLKGKAVGMRREANRQVPDTWYPGPPSSREPLGTEILATPRMIPHL